MLFIEGGGSEQSTLVKLTSGQVMKVNLLYLGATFELTGV